MNLADLFVPHLPEQLRADLTSRELEAILTAIVAQAQGAFAGVAVDEARFLRFVAERVAVDRSVDESLLQLRTAELYLVCACLGGDPQAVAVLEQHYLPATEAAVARMHSTSARPDDVRQILYQKLLVGDGEQPPKLARYSGRGELGGWLRVTAMRIAIDLMRGERRSAPLDDSALLDHLSSPQQDQELVYLKQHYRQEFRAAFQQTLAGLSSRERNVLRLQLLDGLNIDQVGAIYRVHRATVARWNQKVRDTLLSTTRKALLQRLQIDRNEFDSIMRLIQSHFDVSICRHLGPAGRDAARPDSLGAADPDDTDD